MHEPWASGSRQIGQSTSSIVAPGAERSVVVGLDAASGRTSGVFEGMAIAPLGAERSAVAASDVVLGRASV